MDYGLDGRRALVAGASSGLGRACAATLVGEGARVIITGRDEGRLAETARTINAEGFVAGDLYGESGTSAAVSTAAEQLGGLDIVVTNAPHPPKGEPSELGDEDFDKAHAGILLSVVRIVRAARPFLAASGAGRVVNVTSTAARELLPQRVFSSTYRAAVAAFAKHLSVELAPVGATVNNIAPGNVLTPYWSEDAARKAAEEIPLRRLGDAEEVGALCAFLCSRWGGYITGQTIVIDGGLTKFID